MELGEAKWTHDSIYPGEKALAALPLQCADQFTMLAKQDQDRSRVWGDSPVEWPFFSTLNRDFSLFPESSLFKVPYARSLALSFSHTCKYIGWWRNCQVLVGHICINHINKTIFYKDAKIRRPTIHSLTVLSQLIKNLGTQGTNIVLLILKIILLQKCASTPLTPMGLPGGLRQEDRLKHNSIPLSSFGNR